MEVEITIKRLVDISHLMEVEITINLTFKMVNQNGRPSTNKSVSQSTFSTKLIILSPSLFPITLQPRFRLELLFIFLNVNTSRLPRRF